MCVCVCTLVYLVLGVYVAVCVYVTCSHTVGARVPLHGNESMSVIGYTYAVYKADKSS